MGVTRTLPRQSAGLFIPSAGRIGNHISLFAGIGATDLAVEAYGYETVVTAEIDPWCRTLLAKRFPGALHLTDVREVRKERLPMSRIARPLLISGGFPCQGIAGPGNGAGLDDPRSGLWSEFARVIYELRPDKVLIENSPMLRMRGLYRVLDDLAVRGYDARWDCIPAASVGAPHIRDRMFIVATPNRFGSFYPQLPYELSRAGYMRNGVIAELSPLAPVRLAKKMSVAPRMYPTPTRSDGTGGPGTTPKRTGGKNLRTVVNELEGNGRLNPVFVEWMMGLPSDWTNLRVAQPSPHQGWSDDVVQKTTDLRVPERSDRIKALGNALVPQAALVALTSYRSLEA